jgi:pimeloyl-ACP methyl ester carboxylesterase
MNPKNQTKKAAAAVALTLLMSATAWAAMLDYLKIERADLIGYSMGGGVAM